MSDDDIVIIDNETFDLVGDGDEVIEIHDDTVTTNILSGTSDPTSTPSTIGLIYINTTDKRAFISIGTSTSTDWREMFINNAGS